MELEDIERFLQENNLLKLKEKLSKYIYNKSETEIKDFIDKIELNYLPNTRINIEVWKFSPEMLRVDSMMVGSLNREIEKIKFLENWIKENRELKPIKEPKHDHIFAKNGFILFEYLLNNDIKKKGVRGHKSDLYYFYRRLFNDKYIHQKPTQFFEWYNVKYNEEISQFKTLREVKNTDKFSFYSKALDWFKENYQ